jgi:hypothetical protein
LFPNCIEKIYSGAFQLLQLQEDIRRQFKMDGSTPENDVESHVRLNKDTLMNSLWKLNVVDIEVTLLHVCQMVSFSVSSNELKFVHVSFCSFLLGFMKYQLLKEIVQISITEDPSLEFKFCCRC